MQDEFAGPVHGRLAPGDVSRHTRVSSLGSLTGGILELLRASPVVAHRAAAGSVSSGIWENFPVLHPSCGQTGRNWCWVVSTCVLAAVGQLHSLVRATLLPVRPGVQSTRLCGTGLKEALPEFTLRGRDSLTELSFYLQTEQLYWKRFSKHGTAQCCVY